MSTGRKATSTYNNLLSKDPRHKYHRSQSMTKIVYDNSVIFIIEQSICKISHCKLLAKVFNKIINSNIK